MSDLSSRNTRPHSSGTVATDHVTDDKALAVLKEILYELQFIRAALTETFEYEDEHITEERK